MITGGVNRVGEIGKWRQRGERDVVSEVNPPCTCGTVLDYEERNWSTSRR